MILKVFLRKKILGDISVEYLGNISGKNLRGFTGEISGQYFSKEFEGVTEEIFVEYFEEDFRENIDHYTLFADINSQTYILKLNLKFILNLERVCENFQDLNFWDATNLPHLKGISSSRFGSEGLWV
jgi:hypothetical protein